MVHNTIEVFRFNQYFHLLRLIEGRVYLVALEENVVSKLFNVNIEAFPAYDKIYLYFDSAEPSENDDYYEMELDRDVTLLAKFLRKLKPLKDLQTPLKGYLKFAQEVLDKNVHSCYCYQDNLNSIIDAYHQRDRSPDKEFETATDQDVDMPEFITESFTLPEAVMFDGKLRAKGSRLTFYHGDYHG